MRTNEALRDDDLMHTVINACDSLNVTRVHELGGKTCTIAEDAGLLEIARAVESRVRAALASAPPAAEPVGMKLVPMIPTAEMNRVMDSEGWCWEDVLAAAGGITEDEYQDIAASGTHQPAAPQPAEPAQPATQAGGSAIHQWTIAEQWGEPSGNSGELVGMERAAQICDGLIWALDNAGNQYRREACASKCAAAIREVAAQPTEQPSQDANPPR